MRQAGRTLRWFSAVSATRQVDGRESNEYKLDKRLVDNRVDGCGLAGSRKVDRARIDSKKTGGRPTDCRRAICSQAENSRQLKILIHEAVGNFIDWARG